ncbi:MAG: hypothetical protein JXR78_14185 [Victivallales bacterium]|nr:hypothetical protein [Victivallales bacterium]
MKGSASSLICVGQFFGPDIEEGTFHLEETVPCIHHGLGVPQCPCPPVEFPEIAPKPLDGGNKENAE